MKRKARFKKVSARTTKDKNSLAKRRVINVTKWVLYTIFMLMSYVLMQTPGLFSDANHRPLFLIPLVIAISVFEGELAGGIFAIATGIVWDSGVDTIMGFQALILYICCVIAGLFIHYLLKQGLFSTLLLTIGATALYTLYHFFFVYVIWGYDGESLRRLFLNDYIPIAIYTVICTPFFYWIIKLIHNHVRPPQAEELWEA